MLFRSDIQRGKRQPWWNVWQPWQVTVPYFVMYRFPAEFVGSVLCWQGRVLWEGANETFVRWNHIQPACRPIESGDAGRRVIGATDPSLALRLAMLDAAPGSPLRPTVSALVGTSLPLGTTFTSDQAQPSATLMAGWTLGSRLGVLTNAGYTWAAGGQGVARLSGLLSATVGPRGGIFAEAAFQRPQGGWGRPLLSLGFTQLVGSRGQLDLFTRRVGAAGDYVEFGFGLSLAR